MNSLREAAQDPQKRQLLVKELTALVDDEVKRTSGVSGLAVRGGYKVVSSLKGGRMVPIAVNSLLDKFIDGLAPLVERYRESGEARFSSFMVRNERDAVNALLAVTDRRAETASSAVKSAYKKLRPIAEKQVAGALPAVGAWLDRYL